MVKIINPFAGQDPLAAAFARLGSQLTGGRGSRDISLEKLHAAQAWEAERKNAELENLAKYSSAHGGFQGVGHDPVAEAMAILAGVDPKDYGGYGLLGAATQYGRADPRTQDFQVGTGEPYSSTADAYTADQSRMAAASAASVAEQQRAHEAAVAQQAAADAQASMDRRYNTDQSNIGAMARQNAEPIAAMVPGPAGPPVAGPGGIPIAAGAPGPMTAGFVPKGQAATSGAAPILQKSDVEGRILGDMAPGLSRDEKLRVIGAAPPSTGGGGAGSNWLGDDGKVYNTHDGVTETATGKPLPPGHIVSVTGSASDTLTPAGKTALQGDVYAGQKFNALISMALPLTQDPMLFGPVGFVRSKAQDLLQSLGGVQGALGAGQDLAKSLTDEAGNLLGPQAAQSLLPQLYDPRLPEVETLWGLIVYQGAAALAGQQNRSVSDKDVILMRDILGDPHSLFASNQSMATKLQIAKNVVDRFDKLARQQLQTPLNAASGAAGALPTFNSPDEVKAAVAAGKIKRGEKFNLPDGRIGTVP